MLDNSGGRIFLAGERGHTETESFRSYNTFHFGEYRCAGKEAFGNLYLLNEETIDAGKRVKMSVESDSEIVILPIVGAVLCHDDHGNELLVNSGEVQTFFVRKSHDFELSNPYEHGLINFIQLWFYCNNGLSESENVSFDIDETKNQLVRINSSRFRNLSIGKFEGRAETLYRHRGQGAKLFVFVIQGAFEVQYRLLETHDGLALWNVEEVEIEALSNEAIILLIEM